MKQYIDLRILPDPEFPTTQLMGALFAKLHRGLVAIRTGDIGVSFPAVSLRPNSLGDLLRLHGDSAALNKLIATEWLGGMTDHVRVSPVLEVPSTASSRTVSRVQAKSNPERLRRRQIRRHGLDVEQARERVPDSAAELLDLPFVQLRSQSTGQAFRLFVRHGPLQSEPSPGPFGTYGLSPQATIPWF